MSESAIRLIAGVLNNVVTLLEEYLEVPEERLPEVKARARSAGPLLARIIEAHTA